MADLLYKCTHCGFMHKSEDGQKPETCEKCSSKDTLVAVAQEPGQFGCVGK
jgi:DNA-directed RNA polymerase subunit RPC12/RpoP